ncbi:MAG: hypothetical protein ABGX16_16095 [Pirellulales bacterium]
MLSYVVILSLCTLWVAIFIVLLRQDRPMWLMLLLLLVPVIIASADINLQVISAHGFMHASIVYELDQRGVPPENPLLAGEPLHYPYGHHYLISQLIHVLPVAPGRWFVFTNLLCLLLFSLVLERIARLFSPDRTYRILAVFISLVGCNPFANGPLREPFLMLSLPNENRTILLGKFLSINSNSLGLLCFAVAFLGLLRLITNVKGSVLSYLLIASGFVGAAFLYPVVWPGILVCIGLAALYLWYLRIPGAFQTGGYLMVILIAGVAVVMPWFWSIGDGKAASAMPQIISFRGLLRNALVIVTSMTLPIGLAWFMRKTLMEKFRAHLPMMQYCLLCLVALQVMFWLIFIPIHSEYKYLAMSEIPLALILALLLQKLLERRWVTAMVVLFFVSLPVNWVIWRNVVSGYGPVSDPVVCEGNLIIHQEPNQQALYQWIRQETKPNAVFIDTYLTVPPFAQRQLFVGLDARRDSGQLHGRDGWSMTAKMFLELVNGSDPQVLERRRYLAKQLLLKDNSKIYSKLIHQLIAEVPGRNLYIIAREPEVKQKLSHTPGIQQTYSNSSATVFQVLGSNAIVHHL